MLFILTQAFSPAVSYTKVGLLFHIPLKCGEKEGPWHGLVQATEVCEGPGSFPGTPLDPDPGPSCVAGSLVNSAETAPCFPTLFSHAPSLALLPTQGWVFLTSSQAEFKQASGRQQHLKVAQAPKKAPGPHS